MGVFDFLNQQGASGGGSMVSDIIALGSLFGPKQNVLDSRDFEASMDQANVNNTLNITRSNEFLAGVTPTNAAMYNQYQDATFNEDTSRQITRVQRTADALNMSPWELQGNNLTTPIPADMGGGGRANAAPQYMASVMPAAIASMQSKTQLAIARMNNETALKMKGLEQGEGDLAKSTIALNLSNLPINQQKVLLTEAETGLTKARQGLTEAQQFLASEQAQTEGYKQTNFAYQNAHLRSMTENNEASRENIPKQGRLIEAQTAATLQNTDESAARTTRILQDQIIAPLEAVGRLLPTQSLDILGAKVTQKQDWEIILKAMQGGFKDRDTIPAVDSNKLKDLGNSTKAILEEIIRSLSGQAWADALPK